MSHPVELFRVLEIPVMVLLGAAVVAVALIARCIPQNHPIPYAKLTGTDGDRTVLVNNPERLPSVRRRMDEYVEIAGKGLVPAPSRIERIGHQAGSFREYGKHAGDVDRPLRKYRSQAPVMDVTVLMKSAFEDLKLDGIEIDVQTVPGNDPTVYVVHDPVSAVEVDKHHAYFNRNRLQDVIGVFIQKGYFLENKLFIEIKTHNKIGAATADDMTLLARTLDTIEGRLRGQGGKDGDEIRRMISFVSFNLAALDSLHVEATRRGLDYEFRFIAGTNQAGCKCVARLSKNPVFSDDADRLKKAHWLTGVWFDANLVPDFAKLLDEVNSSRNSRLEVGLSTYYGSFRAFRKRLKKERQGPYYRPESIIFEIDAMGPPSSRFHKRRGGIQ